MTTSTSAKRYAHAAFDIAREKNRLDEWRSDIRRVAELMKDPEVTDLLENPRLSFDLKAKLAKEKLGGMNQLALNFCYLLIAKGRFRNAEQIADEYDRLLDDSRGIKHADVTTAVPTEASDKGKLEGRLQAMVGKKVVVNLHVDPTILGGMVVRIDGKLIDGSVRSKLGALKRSLVETKTSGPVRG